MQYQEKPAIRKAKGEGKYRESDGKEKASKSEVAQTLGGKGTECIRSDELTFDANIESCVRY